MGGPWAIANHPATRLLLREGDREKLTWLVHSTSVRAGLAQRARIVLLAVDGISDTEIAQKVGATRIRVIVWRACYGQAGIAGLADHDRSGWLRRIDHRAIVAATLRPPSKKLRSRVGPPGCWRPGWASTTAPS